MAQLIEPFRAAGGTVGFVRFTCPPETLIERVAAESRRAYGKLVDPEILCGLMERNDLLSPVPHGESFPVDTGELEPAEAARRITAHFGLSLVSHPPTL